MTPEQRAKFIENVPDAEQRREAERLWHASHVAGQAFAQACILKNVGVKIEDPETKSESEIEAEFEAAFNAQVAAEPDLIPLRAAANQALQAWLDCADYGEPLESSDGEIIRCALTGFIVFDGDKYLIDVLTFECILKVALGIPLGFIAGEFRTDDEPLVAIADDALSAAELV
jgi:hypothetical protein